MTRNLILVLCFFSLAGTVQAQNAWSYVGIPYTDWTYDPFTVELEKPSSWPSMPQENYYYVEPNHPNATDAILSGESTGAYGRFGYPDRPRLTIPSDRWIGDVFEAGTVLWLKGGTYGLDHGFYGTWSPEFHGSATRPIWIHGDPEDKPIFNGLLLGMYNSQHTIVDNIQWIGGNASNTVLTLTRDREGATHHITLKNLLFENLEYIGGGGAIIGLTATNADGAELHDVVAYQNTFKNCGIGYDWSTNDNDHHAYKVNGNLTGNQAYRIWVIDNTAVAGDTPDSADGLLKSLSGNLVQVGDQIAASGGNHHVFVAGNYQEFARQALGWTKRATDVIFSSNYCTDTYTLAGGNGQCYGHQYGLGDYNWWIGNVGTKSGVGWQHTANDPMEGPLFIVGNLFYNNRDNESNDNWRLCSGISLFSQHGEHYIVNNIFDNNCHGVWSGTNRHGSTDKLHIYNNIFTNISATVDQTSRAITFDTTNGIEIHIGNNLFDTYNNSVRVNSINYTSLSEFNEQPWATNNTAGSPMYTDVSNEDYNILEGSPAIDGGTQTYLDGSLDVYQHYLNRYAEDPLYPGNPQDYWPKDIMNRNRVENGTIDIGPYEFSDGTVIIEEEENAGEQPTFMILPNPAQEEITVVLPSEETVSSIEVYTVSGQMIKRTEGIPRMDISNMASGVYVIQISSSNGSKYLKKIVKD